MTHGALDDTTRRSVERWLIRRGVPQLIEGYATEQSMDARATPLILAWLIAGSLLAWGAVPFEAAMERVRGAVLMVGLVMVALWVIFRLRGRRAIQPEPTYDLLDIATCAVLPAAAAFLFYRSPAAALVAGQTTLLVVGAIYVVIGFGIVWIVVWSVGWIVRNAARLVGLVARTLPLLLILVAFLLFSSELWQAARGLTGLELAAVVLLAVAAGASFLAARLGRDLRALDEARDWAAVLDDVRATPAEPLTAELRPLDPAIPPLRRVQRVNVALLVLISQALQAAFVALVVALFLVAFGLIVVPGPVQQSWTGAGLTSLATFEALGEERVLSAELLAVASLLGSFAGLYFAGFSLADPDYRAEMRTTVLADVRRTLAVRAVYVAALATGARASASAE